MTLTEKGKADRYDRLQLAIKKEIEKLKTEADECERILKRDGGAVSILDCVILGKKRAYESLKKDLEMWI